MGSHSNHYRVRNLIPRDLFSYSSLFIIFSVIVTATSTPTHGSSSSGISVGSSGGSSTPQNVNHVIDYLNVLKRSQDEVFRKIDWLTKTVEEKDHEDYKFRLKFSRKVHTLENKVLYMEQTFTQKVEEVVQKKLDEISDRLRYQYQTFSSGAGASTSHGGSNSQLQNQQPQPFTSRTNNRYQPKNQYHPPNYQNNWGFYEHPITQKRVRDTNFGYEPPTRELPLMSLVANAPDSSTSRSSDMTGGGSIVSLTSSATGPTADSEGVRERGQLTSFIEVSQRRFESLDTTLQSLKENLTTLEKEMNRMKPQHRSENDYTEIYKLLADHSKDIIHLSQKHQEISQQLEHFSAEMEKAAAKRDNAINDSFHEMSSEIKRQISAVKAYTKRHVQNLTALASTQPPDKFRCAQTLLDELLAQLSRPRSNQQSAVNSDLIADQADNDRDEEYPPGQPQNIQYRDNLTKELQLQRQEISELKSEIARLNISQVLLMRTVDEETLKRTVRPRDCSEIRLLRNVSSGVYSIFPRKNDNSTDVYCDMETDGGGWTVIQRRGEPVDPLAGERRESFIRTWNEYEDGFGSLTSDFWLGLSNIAALCQLGVQELRVELTNWSGEKRYANYHYFKISNASDLYRINVSGYSGNAGDSLIRHNGMAFSTPDRDHDTDPRRHCAKMYFSGWWYYACFESNLNGLYLSENDSNGTYGFGTGMIWQHWMGTYSSLKHVEIKIRNTFIGDNQYTNKIAVTYS
ncbi:unnamed protein product [Orchesella dallaii]|uniref:Fibrinogen C-terminal domain-containing protein n=1 Tax=Orchesella dallaii TaxID=48710 RepID=A0ABP1S3D3_9HEXA